MNTTNKFIGYIDKITPNQVEGWVYDQNSPNHSLVVNIYQGQVKLDTIQANRYRPDVANAGYGTGNYGFCYSSTTPLNTTAITVKVANSNYKLPLCRELSNRQHHQVILNKLRQESISIQPKCPFIGYIDLITTQGIDGWVCDLNNLDQSLDIDIYINDIKIQTISANRYRPDIHRRGLGTGNYGFRYVFQDDHLTIKKVKVVVHNSDYKLPLSESRAAQLKMGRGKSKTDPLIELISVHIPKTAGTTFANCLKKIYDPTTLYFDYGLDFSSPKFFLPFKIPSNFKVIHGHFGFSYYDDYFLAAKRVTWLRDPVKMLISLYYHWRVAPSNNNPASLQYKVKAGEIEFKNFIEYPQCQNILCTYTNNNLNSFYFVGLTEYFKEDFNNLRLKMNWPEIEMVYENKNMSLDYQVAIRQILGDRELIKKIEHLNQADIHLYQTALNLRSKRIDSGVYKNFFQSKKSSNLFF